MQPEQRARHIIDTLLTTAGWTVCNLADWNPFTPSAIREVNLQTGFADYLLMVDGKALGVIEAKPAGTTLSGIAHQSDQYAGGLPGHIKAWRDDIDLPFRYESTGTETYVTNRLDPQPRARRVFAFHQPATLRDWITEPATLRRRLQQLPPLDPAGLWPPQVRAIDGLEASLAQDRPRALIQMATGSGKTFTAVNAVYRLIKHGRARRILFLVDRTNLGTQALNEFQTFATPDDGRKFTELYNVQHLTTNHIDTVANVTITTIQRLYSILSGDPDFDPAYEEQSAYELAEADGQLPPRTVSYNPAVPIETFDVIIIDECHRSIYSTWGQVLEYFDAYLIGLTATPSKLTIGFFKQNLVMEYGHLQAVADGINVPGETYHIRTRISEDGSTITVADAGYVIKKMDRSSREVLRELMDADFDYTARQLDRDVQSESQIRTIVREFRDRLFVDLFPGRTEVPKTLVFAKDDTHAEKIVEIVREEFARGNDFCQKITYRVSGKKPADLIRDFRTDYNPRIAVTVDMIATGTDIRAIEILLFLRLVKSRNYFEQMRGRGTRIISPDMLQTVTGDAPYKDHFVLVDAVGVTEVDQVERTPTLNRKRSATLPDLLTQLKFTAHGPFDPDLIATIADRLARLQRKLDPADRAAIQEAAAGASLADLTHALVDSLDPQRQIDAALAATAAAAPADPTEAQLDAAAQQLMAAAARPLQTNAPLTTLLNTLYERTLIVLDEISQDTVTRSAFETDPTAAARRLVTSFRDYIAAHKDELTALEIIFDQPYNKRALTFEAVRQLADQIEQPPHHWTTQRLWEAYRRLERDRVRGAAAPRVLSDLVALVRHTVTPDDELRPYPELVAERYQAWLDQQAAAGRIFPPAAQWWLDHIAAHIGVNLAIRPEHFDYGDFFDRGGRGAARRDLGPDWLQLLDELNQALVVV